MEMPAPGAKRAFVIVGQSTLPVQPDSRPAAPPSLDHGLGEIEGEFPIIEHVTSSKECAGKYRRYRPPGFEGQ
jgi:hypothetical protein